MPGFTNVLRNLAIEVAKNFKPYRKDEGITDCRSLGFSRAVATHA